MMNAEFQRTEGVQLDEGMDDDVEKGVVVDAVVPDIEFEPVIPTV